MPRDEVVRRLMAVFREHGYDGASLAELSRASGLGKSSLYHYFPGGKEDMARAVLEEVERWLAEHVVAPLAASGPPAQRLSRMAAALDGLYDGGRAACLLGNMLVGDSRRLFIRPLKAAFGAWVAALAALARDAGMSAARARTWGRRRCCRSRARWCSRAASTTRRRSAGCCDACR
jgi:TetR/AcrR family transcriptional repressor of lmrAB and yxaGH operons